MGIVSSRRVPLEQEVVSALCRVLRATKLTLLLLAPVRKHATDTKTLANSRNNQGHSCPTPVSLWKRKVDSNERKWENSEILILEPWVGLLLLPGLPTDDRRGSGQRSSAGLRGHSPRHDALPESSSTAKACRKGHLPETSCVTHAVPPAWLLTESSSLIITLPTGQFSSEHIPGAQRATTVCAP